MENKPYIRRLTLWLSLAVMVAVAACSPVDRLRRASEHDRGDFRSNLAAEYLAFAESEGELGRHTTRDLFARKGLKALRDTSTPPEHPADWEIHADLRTELLNARNRLMRVRSDFFQRVSGHLLARAQLLYDCWVMQAADHTDDELALPCRSEFLGDLTALEHILDTLGPNPKVSLPAHYTIRFPIGGARLDNNGAFVVQEVLAITRLYPEHRIYVTGHTDRAGSSERNLQLSIERAEHVVKALVEAGIAAESIEHSGEGEDNPAIPTLDGFYSVENRRVEIAVLPPPPSIGQKPDHSESEPDAE